MTRPPLALWAYLALAAVSTPLWRGALALRQRRGKEDGARLPEKFGSYTRPRPPGRLIWFHAVSVGESLALVTLLRRLLAGDPGLHVLLTTSTRASVEALGRVGLPERVIHQMAPVDAPGPVRRFLAHWRPDAAVIAEADMWPLTLLRTHATGVPLMMLNTTITPRRLRQRRPLRHSYARLFALFERMLMQDDEARQRFVDLGAPADRMEVMGVLKAASDPLPDRPEARAALAAQLGDRPRWLAAVTHACEDAGMVAAHALVAARRPDCLMIVAPRQTHQADALEVAARARFAHVARRSRGEGIGPDTQVYIADTIGEMGLWYRLSPIAFLGHSLPPDDRPMTGKNPFEAMALGAVVLHGPRHDNFTETYRRLAAARAAQPVGSGPELAAQVLALLDPAARRPLLEAAQTIAEENLRPLDIALDRVQAFLDRRLGALPRPVGAPTAPTTED